MAIDDTPCAAGRAGEGAAEPAAGVRVLTPEERAQRRAAAYARGRAQLAAAFDPEAGLCIARTELATRHLPRTSLEYARCLLRDAAEGAGGAADVSLGVRIVERALDAQELEPGHPHHGGFKFGLEDAEVTGLNVTSFVLQQLLAIWHESRQRLPVALQAALLGRVRLALGELARVNVHPRYTNPALMDAANTILWGDVLDEPGMGAAGRGKLDAWIALTARSGAPYEYNSPTYLAIDLSQLATLAELARDPAVRLKAQVMEERIWLHALLHYHAPTGRLAGPHSRAYHASMHGAADGVAALFWQELGLDDAVAGGPYLPARDGPAGPANVSMALTTYHCPLHFAAWAEAQRAQYPYEVRETADRATGADLATSFSPVYALGTAARTYSIGQGGFDIEHEANYCIVHYRRETSWAMLYTRFVVNDRYHGSIEQHALRSRRTNFYDQGLFAGHQHAHAAIALYGLELQDQGIWSVEALAVLPNAPASHLGRGMAGESRGPAGAGRPGATPATLPRPIRPAAVYVEGKPVDLGRVEQGQPAPVPDGTWVVVEDGAVWIGLRPLARDQMGQRREMEVRTLPAGELALAMPHYRGPEKWFWEYASPEAAFYRRNIRSGLLLVIGERAMFPTYGAFASHLAAADLVDTLDAQEVRTVTYRDGSADLSIRYDLVGNRTLERRTGGRVYAAPALDAPWAVQAADGEARLGQAALSAGGRPAVLFARDQATAPEFGGAPVWEALVLSDEPGPLRLQTPAGTVTCERFGFGAVRLTAVRGAPAAPQEASQDAGRTRVRPAFVPGAPAYPQEVAIRCATLTAPVSLPAAPGGRRYVVTLDGDDVAEQVEWRAGRGWLPPAAASA